jgi:hypothetical protein
LGNAEPTAGGFTAARGLGELVSVGLAYRAPAACKRLRND